MNSRNLAKPTIWDDKVLNGGSRQLITLDGKYFYSEEYLTDIPAEEIESAHPGHPRLVVKEGKRYFKYSHLVETFPKEGDTLIEFGSIYQIQNGHKVYLKPYTDSNESYFHIRHSNNSGRGFKNYKKEE